MDPAAPAAGAAPTADGTTEGTGRGTAAGQTLRGVIPPLCTPLTSAGDVDLASLDRLVDHVLSAGVSGVFVLGSTGEGSELTDEQRRQVVGGAVARVNGRVPVLAGALEPSTARVTSIASEFRDLGADAIVATAPYYFHAGERETEQHFRTIHEQVGLPLVAYDIPVRVHVKLPLSVLVRLARDGVLIAVKDSSGDETLMRALLDDTADVQGFTVLTGSEVLARAQMSFGVHGNVPGLGNVDPGGFVRLYRAAMSGDDAAAAREQTRIAALAALESAAEQAGTRTAIAAFKAALVLLGVIEVDAMAPPSSALSDVEVDRVRQVLVEAELL
jgi:4-hydroxy-tetrahydrodipicolinate synthase